MLQNKVIEIELSNGLDIGLKSSTYGTVKW